MAERDELSPEEAERISQHARDGRLDTGDPQIRRVVTRAQRTVARHWLWGDVPRRRRMLILAVAVGSCCCGWRALPCRCC